MMDIDFALNPDLKLGRTRSKERLLSEKAISLCAH
ncbi:hypothetical protein LMG6871_00447 [Ralstonia edaphis]|nr:hypothetical protein LMG6871_00447 [Ralstonia sp. LMG 6871]